MTATARTGIDVLDVAVHPNPSSDAELREYLPRSLRDRPFPGLFRYLYPPPTGIAPYGKFLAESRDCAGFPASDPDLVRAHLTGRGTGRAVLLPQTRGTVPAPELSAGLCAATNDWLADRWLGVDGFLGSIRIDPLYPAAAIAEIDRWADDPRMVQVAVPLESLQPYGHPLFWPVWQHVADRGLPVAVYTDGVSGASFHPTPGGFPRHHIEYAALYRSNFVYHLTSLITHGVVERMPGLRFTFTDGGFDVLMPLMWRFDMDWPISRVEAPWVRRMPSEYLAEHFRFVLTKFDGPADEATLREWAEISDAGRLLLYGSHYPDWSALDPVHTLPGTGDDVRERVLATNAAAWLRLT